MTHREWADAAYFVVFQRFEKTFNRLLTQELLHTFISGSGNFLCVPSPRMYQHLS